MAGRGTMCTVLFILVSFVCVFIFFGLCMENIAKLVVKMEINSLILNVTISLFSVKLKLVFSFIVIIGCLHAV